MIIWAGISRCRMYSRMRNHANQSHRSSASAHPLREERNSRLSHASNPEEIKRLSFPASAPVYESQELRTIRDVPGTGNAQPSAPNWAGLQPFNTATNDYAPIQPAPATNQWTGLQWIDDSGTNRQP